MWLEETRRDKGMTQQDLAQAIGINRASLSKLENGKMNPSIGLAKKLGKALGFEWTRFYEDTEEEA